MNVNPQNQCSCVVCQQTGECETKKYHYAINFFLSRLTEPQKAIYIGMEARRRGQGGEKLLAQITGWSESAILDAMAATEKAMGSPTPSERDHQDPNDIHPYYTKIAPAGTEEVVESSPATSSSSNNVPEEPPAYPYSPYKVYPKGHYKNEQRYAKKWEQDY
jgi:hypothetical protein